jgi:hypothetical protein
MVTYCGNGVEYALPKHELIALEVESCKVSK